MYFLFSYIYEFGFEKWQVKLYFDKDYELNDWKGKYFFQFKLLVC